MEHPALLWAAAGLVLVIVELMTGTFYLLMLGVAAFGAALAAAFQCLSASVKSPLRKDSVPACMLACADAAGAWACAGSGASAQASETRDVRKRCLNVMPVLPLAWKGQQPF